jgi:Domain of unknown function (DUF5615)
VRFLVDECLSVELVTVAAEAGCEAHHVAHVGKAGWKDWNVLRHASESDFVLVTNNAADFRKLYAEESAGDRPQFEPAGVASTTQRKPTVPARSLLGAISRSFPCWSLR